MAYFYWSDPIPVPLVSFISNRNKGGREVVVLLELNPGPQLLHLSVFYSPGENCDSLPAHTKFSGGKMDPKIVTGKMSPP